MNVKKRLLAAASVIALAAAGVPAFATDGVTLIDQAKVINSGGFPYHITAPGSYRLSGNLVAQATTAIIITSSDVTLDLNGFTVSCNACFGVPGIQAIASRTAILNGNVTGFRGTSGAPYGIYLQIGDGPFDFLARINHVNADGNAVGIFANSGVSVSVTDSSASFNSSIGINTGPLGTLTVTNSRVSNNGVDGIVMGSGVVTGSAIVGNGLTTTNTGITGGIAVGGASTAATITNNTIAGSYAGIRAILFSDPVIGYGSNTFAGNVIDVLGGPSPIVSMHNNACSFGLC